MSVAVAKRPDGGLAHHLPRLLAQASRPSRFTPDSARSWVAAIDVGGITAIVGMGRPLAAVSSCMVATRSAMVNRVVRPVEHGPAAGVAAEVGHQQPELHG